MDLKDLAAVLPLLVLLLAATTFINQRLEVRRTYLRLSISTEDPVDGILLVNTKIDNVVVRVKKLTAVFLVLGPEAEDPMDTINTVFRERRAETLACCPISLRRFLPPTTGADRSGVRRIMTLPYFTEENINVADELLTYSKAIDVSTLPPGCYSVRMYVYGENRLYRLVQTAFVIPKGSPSRNTASRKNVVARPPCAGLKHCHRSAG